MNDNDKTILKLLAAIIVFVLVIGFWIGKIVADYGPDYQEMYKQVRLDAVGLGYAEWTLPDTWPEGEAQWRWVQPDAVVGVGGAVGLEESDAL